MKFYPKTHLWLLIPFVLAIVGFFFSYWLNFLVVPFRHHVHGLSATAWFIIVIIQPYLYQKQNLKLHRKIGFFGLFLSGGVIFSSMQMLPFNLTSGMPIERANGLIFMDLFAVFGFSYSVLYAMMNVKDIRKHGRGMVSSILWVLQPALNRLIAHPMNIISDGNPPITFTQIVYIVNSIILAAVLVIMYDDYRKEKKIYPVYLVFGLSMIIMTLLYTYMGSANWWGTLLKGILKI